MEKNGEFIWGEYALGELDMLRNVEWVGHEKIDGTNIRVYFNGLGVWFKGRTDKADIPTHLQAFLLERFTVEKMQALFPNLEKDQVVCIYGEGCGHKIQKNGLRYTWGRKEATFILFDVKIDHWYMNDDFKKQVADHFVVDTAPLIGSKTLIGWMELIAEGWKSTYTEGDTFAEGVIVKPRFELFRRNGDRIITKIKHKDFYGKGMEVGLLKGEA